jgi:hypothetical protein
VDLTAKCHDPLKFQVENDNEEDGVLGSGRLSRKFQSTCFASWSGGNGRRKGDSSKESDQRGIINSHLARSPSLTPQKFQKFDEFEPSNHFLRFF